MDEDEVHSVVHIPSENSEKCLDNLTRTHDVVESASQYHDDCSEEEDPKLHKSAPNLNRNTLDSKNSISQIHSPIVLETETAGNANKETGIIDLENCYNRMSNNKEDMNVESSISADLESMNNNIEEIVNTNLVVNENIASIEESVAPNSLDEILAIRELGICSDDQKIVVSNECKENLLIESSNCIELAISDSEISPDKINAVEIVPENIINAADTHDAKRNRDDPVGTLLPNQSDTKEEETIFDCGHQIHDEISLPNSLDCDRKEINFENNSVEVQVSNLKSSDNLIRSKSVAELNTGRTHSKPNSLAEDAKLVKFSVSSKSVNLMQSNAQFLNKSRNFLNFITEKSTNIMEKTLLPQNIAAKYNSILRMTENNPTNCNLTLKSENGSENSCDTSSEIVINLTKLDMKDPDTDNLYNRDQKDEPISDSCSVKEDPIKEYQNVSFKYSVNENISNQVSTPGKQDSETTSSPTFQNKNSEHGKKNYNFGTPNVIEKEKIHRIDLGSRRNSSDKILTALPNERAELLCRERNTENMGIEEKDLAEECEINDVVQLCRNAVDAIVPPTLETGSIECLNQEQMIAEQDDQRNSKDESVDRELLAHPDYVALLRDYSNLKDESKKLSEAKVKVEMENQRLAAENSGELYALQLETLEKTIEQLRHDLKQATTSQELINREYLLANKEKESMVMKYAISEKQLIDTQRAREYAERKINEALKEQELLHTKLKQVQGERTRICNILDGKCHELTDAQKEVDRLKEELNMREVKLKWTQNKLKTELETHKENQQKLDKAMLRINEMKEECEQVRKESQETIRKFQQSEENKVVTLDHQLKEQQARLILERHVTEDKEMSRLQLQKEVETLKQRQHVLIEENNTLSLKVQNLEKERLNYENNLSNLKVIADQRQKEIVDLVGKVSQLETLKLQLKHKEQLLSSNEAEVERLRQSNTELQSDMEWCREREAHMLEFTQKLTDKNVRLQSEFTSMEAKNEQLELEQGPLQDEIKELTSKVKALEISLASEKSKRTEECELLARHVAEQTQLARNLSQKLEDSQGENAVLRRKQQISVKEMTKELQQCKKRLDAFETGSPSNSLDRTSRTGSSSSLSTGETLNGAVSDNSNSGGDHILQTAEPDRQTLIDRIVKLQKIRVRQAEKLDFLEEHTRTLVNELQKKTKIIKNYILHENPDAMGSNERDRNKAELARHGGIMASVYNQRVSDDNMTLELSLEINQKLQAVLEDTLLKNITLKDSIDTLGGEIARLTMQNKRRQ